jgi:hypothetical protein
LEGDDMNESETAKGAEARGETGMGGAQGAPRPQAMGEREEMMMAMFASLVMQQTNMASIFLGLAPHPQTGKRERDLEHARYFIDQLEMLEAKTRGNLDKREEALLKQSLTSLRLAFVEVASHPAEPAPGGETKAETEKGGPAPAAAAEGAGGTPKPEAQGVVTPGAGESHKKFTKKYESSSH